MSGTIKRDEADPSAWALNAICGSYAHSCGPLTGAGIIGDTLALALVEQRSDRTVQLSASQAFVLRNRGADALKALQTEIECYCTAMGIKEIVQRAGTSGGVHSAGFRSFKIEAALQLIPGISFRFAHFRSIGPYKRWAQSHLPLAHIGASQNERSALSAAIATVGFVHELQNLGRSDWEWNVPNG